MKALNFNDFGDAEVLPYGVQMRWKARGRISRAGSSRSAPTRECATGGQRLGSEARYPSTFHIGFIHESDEGVNEINRRLKDDGFDGNDPSQPAPFKQAA